MLLPLVSYYYNHFIKASFIGSVLTCLFFYFLFYSDPEDYHFDEIMVTFPNGETTVSINVPVNNDDINEMSETFDLQIAVNELEARVLPGTPDVTTILIKDDDSKEPQI